MDTLRYIVKRLLLAVLILFGVSIIIYALARMMPTDYVDNQYSAAVSQGTMRQEDVDRIKELYGLSMPDAYLSMQVGEGSAFAGTTFTKNAKSEYYDTDLGVLVRERARLLGLSEGDRPADYDEQLAENEKTLQEKYLAFYEGEYDAGDTRLVLYKDGRWEIGHVTTGEAHVEGSDADSSYIRVEETFTPAERGTWALSGHDADRTVRAVTASTASGATLSLESGYRTAGFFDKAGAIFEGYFGWLFNMLRGDFGLSFKYKKPVKDVIFQNMGISFAIAFVATVLQFAIAIPLGIKAATHQYGVIDYSVTVFAMIGISLPTFFLAALVIRLFAVQLGWFEVGGIASSSLPMDASWIERLGDTLWHMVLPMFVLVVLSIGSLMRYTRTNTLEALNADYVRTARAKGLPEHTVINKHAFRNTMIPLVTMMAGILPSLFGGAMITETVFSIPGIGKLAYDALVVADVPFIMGYNIFIAVLTVIGTLLSDLMYAVVDPRVKLGR